MSDRVTVVKSDYDKTIEVRVIGEFVFDLHKEFRETYRENDDKLVRYIINMASTTYMDSSALAMLLLMLKHLDNDRSRLIIRHASDRILKIFNVVKFDQLITIE